MEEYDGPWKEAIDDAFDLVLALFFPDILAAVDWSQDHEALEQELQKLRPASPEGVRRLDKLFRAVKKETGDPCYLHLEVQMARDPDFGRRMLDYWARARERFSKPPICLVILGDEDRQWRPSPYHEGEMGSEVTLQFREVKLVEWTGREAELEASDNLFALFVAAHLATVATRKDEAARRDAKRRIVKNYATRQLNEIELQRWYRVIDWLMKLPPEMDAEMWAELRKDKEVPVRYITTAERVGREEGRIEGREEGRQETVRRTLHSVLKAKFGPAADALAPQIEAVTDAAKVEELIAQAAVAPTLDDFCRHLPPK